MRKRRESAEKVRIITATTTKAATGNNKVASFQKHFD